MKPLLIVNSGNLQKVYQGLSNNLTAIEQPTFALLVANYLKQFGIPIEVIDMPCYSTNYEDIAERVKSINPALVTIFVYGYQPNGSTQNMQAATDVATAIKNLIDVPILLTGTHPAALPEQSLGENIDFVCDREGFVTLKALYEVIPNDDYSHVPDLWYKKGTQIYFTQRGQLLTSKELNERVTRPAWELVDMKHYRCHNWQSFGNPEVRQPYASLYTSLGCPFRCSFCCINAPFGNMHDGSPRPYRLWDSKVIIKQIDILYNEYGVRIFKIIDEMFLLNRRHVEDLCDLIIERGYSDINVWAYARIDTVIDDLLYKMRKAGFRWLALGIESGSSFVRDGSSKSFDDQDIFQVVKKIQENDINVIGNYIFGLPDDNLDTMQKTLELAINLKTEWYNGYSAMAYPGSPLYKMATENGWELPETWLGYSQHAYETFPLRTKHITSREVLAFRDYAHIAYFSDPEYLSFIGNKFGQPTVDEISRMLEYKMKRKILESD